MGVSLCLRVVSLPPPPKRPQTQLLTVFLPRIPYVPFHGWVKWTSPPHNFRSNRSVSIDQFCTPNGVVPFGRILICEEETRSPLHVVCADICVCPLQQGLHLAGEHVRTHLLRKLTLCAVFLVVPPFPSPTYSPPLPLPGENGSFDWGVDGYPSTLAE